MFCGIGIRMYGDLNILLYNKRFTFKEEEKGCFVAKYWGFNITLNYNLGFVDLDGSFHRFKNGGGLNYDRFRISQFIDTLKEFEKVFELDKFDQKYFWGLEFGVNVYLPYDPWRIIESILPYSGTGIFKQKDNGIRIEHDKYYDFKLYAKSDQIARNKKYSADYVERYTLRPEIKVYNMKFINEIVAKTSLKKLTKMSDLVHTEVLHALKNRLIEEFKKLLIVDLELFDESELSPKDRELYKNAWKSSYWKLFKCTSDHPKKKAIDKNKERKIKKIKSIIFQKNELINEIIPMIIKELDYIIDIENVAISTIWNNPKSEIILRKKGDHEAYKERLLSQFPPHEENIPEEKMMDLFGNEIQIEIPHIKQKGRLMSPDFYLDKLGICDKIIEEYECCPTVGLPLFLGIKNGKFLSTEEVEFYHDYYPEVYSELLKIIAPIHHNKPLPIVFEKIAHAIRNYASNLKRKERKRLKEREGQLLIDL